MITAGTGDNPGIDDTGVNAPDAVMERPSAARPAAREPCEMGTL